MILPVFGRYDYLRHGRYRAVKCLQTKQGQYTIAAEFSIGFLDVPS